MFEIGDIVLHDVLVGTVVGMRDGCYVCNCSDGTQKVFSAEGLTRVTTYQEMLVAFKRGIMENASR